MNMNPGGIQSQAGAQVRMSHEGTARTWADEHEGIIRSMEQFERYTWPKLEDISYARIEEANRIVPDDMAIIGQYGKSSRLSGNSWGSSTSAWRSTNTELVARLFHLLAPSTTACSRHG